MDSKTLDVLIIGGGFCGLSAARELAPYGLTFELIDAFPAHWGGRAYGYEAQATAAKARLDHGAQYVGDLQNELMDFIRSELPEALVNGATKRKPYPWEVMYLGGKRYAFRSEESTFGIPGCPPGLSALDLMGMVVLIAEIEMIERAIDVVQPWNSPASLLELDKITVAEWLDRPYVTKTVADLIRISVEALLSVEPEEISPFYLLWYCACNDGFFHEINDSEGGPQQYWLHVSMSQVAERFAEPISGRIQRNRKATRIDASGEVVRVTLDDGTTRSARRVIVAMSPHTASRIEYHPQLPQQHRALMSMPMGRTIKCQLFYRTPWWRDSKGKQYDGYVGGANYPVCWVMDNSPEDGNYVLMTFTVGAQADALGDSPSHDAITSTVTTALAYLFDDDRALSTSNEFLKLYSYSWIGSDPFVGGGPNTIMRPGAFLGDDAPARALNEPAHERIYFASAENALNSHAVSHQVNYDWFGPQNLPTYDERGRLTNSGPFATRYSDRRKNLGYMNGAIISGRSIAKRVARSLGKEAASNTEPRYVLHSAPGPQPATAFSKQEMEQLLLGIQRVAAASTLAERNRPSWFELMMTTVLVDMGRVPSVEDRSAAIEHIKMAVESALKNSASEAKDAIHDAFDTLDTFLRSITA